IEEQLTVGNEGGLGFSQAVGRQPSGADRTAGALPLEAEGREPSGKNRTAGAGPLLPTAPQSLSVNTDHAQPGAARAQPAARLRCSALTGPQPGTSTVGIPANVKTSWPRNTISPPRAEAAIALRLPPKVDAINRSPAKAGLNVLNRRAMIPSGT